MELKFLNIGILSWITFLPILGMIAVLFMPKENKSLVRWTSLGVTVAQLIMAGLIYFSFNPNLNGVNDLASMQFVEKLPWININSVSWFGRVQIEYFVGIDGLSVPMIILTALISFVAILASWNIEKSVKGYFALFLLLDTGMMGVFVSLDFFLFMFSGKLCCCRCIF